MFTFAVFSCNRLHYLRNCVESIVAFADTGQFDLLVVDNGSTEPGMSGYLDELALNPCVRYVKRFRDRRPNELYRAMTFAVNWSRERGNAFVNFVQDDCQWLRCDPGMLDRIHECFDRRPDVAQIHASLIWRGKHAKWMAEGGVRIVEEAGRRWLDFDQRPPCDTGFTRVALFDQIGTWPDSVSLKGADGSELGEEWFYRRCTEVGAKRMWSLHPSIGMLYDAAYVRGNERIGTYSPPPRRFYLRPWTEAENRIIDDRGRQGQLSFIDEFAIPDGWVPRSMKVRSQVGRCAVSAPACSDCT